MSNLKEYLESRTNNPFWWAFLVSFVIINWKLVIYSIFEFKSMDFAFFSDNLKHGYWLLIPLGVGLLNAILGQSFTEFLSALSVKVHNETRLWYIKLSNDTTVAKSTYDKVKDQLESERISKGKALSDLASETSLLKISDKELYELRDTVIQRQSILDEKLKSIQARCENGKASKGGVDHYRKQMAIISEEIDLLLDHKPIEVRVVA